MKRLYNGHSINIKPFGGKIVETLEMSDGRIATIEDCSIVLKQEKHVRLHAEAVKEISLIPSLVLLAAISVAMFHLGWKMSFMILLFAPLPTFIKLMGSLKKTKQIRLILTQWVKIYASVNKKPGIWSLLICISLNNKVLIRQWKLQTIIKPTRVRIVVPMVE